VREEAERLVAHEAVDGDLLDAENDAGVGQVLLDEGAGVCVRLHRVRASVRRLHDHLDALPDKFSDVLGAEGGATFPDRLVLSAGSNANDWSSRRRSVHRAAVGRIDSSSNRCKIAQENGNSSNYNFGGYGAILR